MLPNTIALSNGKGGVGKTSLTANLGGLAAISGWRTLLIDLDPQGNLSSDLGYTDADTNDRGENLFNAIDNRETAKPMLDARPGLDVITAGEATQALEELIERRQRNNELDTLHALDEAIAPLASDYNLILLDCPPAMSTLTDLAFTMARHLVIPTRGDAASLNGLTRTAGRFLHVRTTTNPFIDLLGVALFDFGVQDKRLIDKARSQLEEALSGIAPVFRSFIRNSRKAPDDMREMGLLAHEYHQTADAAPKFWEDPGADRFSQAAPGLAGDYQSLATEILALYNEKQRDNPYGE